MRNPLGLELDIVQPLLDVTLLVLPLLLVTSGTAVIIRFRGSRREERQQLKWFAYAAALGFAAILLATFFDLPAVDERIDSFAETLVWIVAPLSLPISAGIAILKYRLYDIDILINRTLVYGALTATLAGVYFGCVLSLQYLLRALSGQESQIAIVASTLAIAALFNPLRRRVQALVDRRFYRRKYDAAQILANFGARLRDETDLESLSDGLIGVVRETMQPEHVSLWLRAPKNE